MISQVFKPWVLLALIFLAGVGTGAVLTFTLGPGFMKPPGPNQLRAHMMEMLTRRLDLTAEQQAKLQPILDQAASEMQTVHHEEVKRMAHIMAVVDDQLTIILTPEQKIQLEKMKSERDKFYGNRLRVWGHPDGPHGPGGPPPGMPGAPPDHGSDDMPIPGDNSTQPPPK